MDSIFELVRDEVKPIIGPLVNHAKRWELYIRKYNNALQNCPLDNQHLKEYKSYYNLLKEAQTQYVAVTKVLLSAVRRDCAEEADEFEEYLKQNGMV